MKRNNVSLYPGRGSNSYAAHAAGDFERHGTAKARNDLAAPHSGTPTRYRPERYTQGRPFASLFATWALLDARERVPIRAYDESHPYLRVFDEIPPHANRVPRVLVACEFSGIVRDAFARRGWDAWSCDLLPSEAPGQHLQDDVRRHLRDGWDLMIAHPSCRYLAVSGARWWRGRESEQESAVDFFYRLRFAPINRIAIENPIGYLSTAFDKPAQIIQPWQFGHGEVKATCLWLKNLPKLQSTNIVKGRHARVHKEPPGANRWKNRSRTLTGIAEAMAAQWGELAVEGVA